MKALDTNALVRFLVNDDEIQGRRVISLFESTEKTGGHFLITAPVLLELLWVLSAVYGFTREELVQALDLLSQMPILEFEDLGAVQQLIHLGRSTRAHLPDLWIGLAGRSRGCESTLTFEKGLVKTGLFEQI
jgi:predicted nucleic-acid-binding protein